MQPCRGVADLWSHPNDRWKKSRNARSSTSTTRPAHMDPVSLYSTRYVPPLLVAARRLKTTLAVAKQVVQDVRSPTLCRQARRCGAETLLNGAVSIFCQTQSHTNTWRRGRFPEQSHSVQSSLRPLNHSRPPMEALPSPRPALQRPKRRTVRTPERTFEAARRIAACEWRMMQRRRRQWRAAACSAAPLHRGGARATRCWQERLR